MTAGQYMNGFERISRLVRDLRPTRNCSTDWQKYLACERDPTCPHWPKQPMPILSVLLGQRSRRFNIDERGNVWEACFVNGQVEAQLSASQALLALVVPCLTISLPGTLQCGQCTICFIDIAT